MDFSKAVKRAMIDQKINISDLAGKVGYSVMYISHLLKGNRRWNEDVIDKVCDVLGLRVQVIEKDDLDQDQNESIKYMLG